ncbi:MAG TPA: FAD-binding dehydrogenase, partial [Clostridiales bacterium]|nr:FAD-binding dehydrogenase [Clostridiales bacterium]
MGLTNHIESADAYDEEMAKAQSLNDPYIFAADSLEELAAKTGIDRDGLLQTAAEYNQACKSHDALFFKDHRYLKPLKGPRFYAVAEYPSGYGSLGGIKINWKTEVVTDDFTPIPGLYAAGTDACTIFGDSYVFILPGNTMGFALNSGRMAGEHAVDYLVNLYNGEG